MKSDKIKQPKIKLICIFLFSTITFGAQEQPLVKQTTNKPQESLVARGRAQLTWLAAISRKSAEQFGTKLKGTAIGYIGRVQAFAR